MDAFQEFLAKILDTAHRQRTSEVLEWVGATFPTLKPQVKWNQPMFTDHGTFIIAFSVSKQHLAVSPEVIAVNHFANQISDLGYSISDSNALFRVMWTEPVHYTLLEQIISFNIKEKADCKTFWRK